MSDHSTVTSTDGAMNSTWSANSNNLLDRIKGYYQHTWTHFPEWWMNPDNRAMHLGWWDCSIKSHHSSLIRSNQVLAGHASINRTSRCLDLGAGVGGTAMWLADTFGASVTALTIVPEQAHLIRQYSGERKLDRLVTPVVGDYHNLEFDDGSFDVVYAQEAICHARDPLAVLSEAYRVLRSGGRLVLMEYIAKAGPASVAFLKWRKAWDMPELIANDSLSQWASDTGFSKWDVSDISHHVLPSVIRLQRQAQVTLPIHGTLSRVGLPTTAQMDNIRGNLGMYKSYVHGDWYYGLFTGQVM